MWCCFFFFSSRRRHTRFDCDWSSDVCSSDLFQRTGRVARCPMSRLTLAALPALAFALALAAWAPLSQAGTEEAPEITDPAGDQLIVDTVPGCAPAAGCQAATRIDVLAVWIDAETETQFNVNIALSNVPTGATTAT